MIDLATAVSQLSLLDDRTLRASVAVAIFEGHHVTGQPFRDSQPEDVFVPILADPEAPRRQIVLAGCREVINRFYVALNDLAAGDPTQETDLAEAADHFSAMLSAARPIELSTQVRSLFEAALHPAIDRVIRGPFADLAVSYAPIDPRPEYWQALLNSDVVPGQAFQALRRIDPRHPRLEGFLAQLWQRALHGKISLRLPFIIDAWSRQQTNPDEAVRKLIRVVLTNDSTLEVALRADCTHYPHSAKWVDWIQSPSVLVPFTMEKSSINPKMITDGSVVEIGSSADWRAISGMQSLFAGIGKSSTFEIENFQASESARSFMAAGTLDAMLYRLLFIKYPYSRELDRFIKTGLERMSSNILGHADESQQITDQEACK